MRKRPLLWMACVFLTGLAYERYEWEILLLLPIAFFLMELWTGARYHTWKICAGRMIVILSAFVFGCAHMQKEENFRNAYLSKLEDGNRITIWGEVKNIETTEYGVRCIFTDCYIRIQEDVHESMEATYSQLTRRLPCNDVMVYTSSTQHQVGQIYEVIGQFQTLSEARNQGNFDSSGFYQSQKIDFAIKEESSKLLGNGLSRGEKTLLKVKERLLQVLTAGMSEHAAGFYSAMILGDKSRLSETTRNLFMVGGISHILAISGLHVSILGKRFYQRLRRCGIGFLVAGILAGTLLLMYVYMIGCGVSALRAAGMMLIYFLAQYWGRSYDMLNSLGAMCLLLLWQNPFLIEYSGLWFSVAALMGVGYVGPTLAEILCDHREEVHKDISKDVKNEMLLCGKGLSEYMHQMKESYVIGFGITLCTLPIVAYGYYEIPLYSTLVNFIILPLLTSVFIIALLGLGIGIWMPEVARMLFLPCEGLLHFYESVCALVEKMPASMIICGKPSVGIIVIYYAFIFIGVWFSKLGCVKTEGKDRRKMKRSMMLAIFMSLLCVFYPKSTLFEISFLEVGQGDGIYISAGDGTTCFIDGGSTSVDGVGEYRILPFLKSKGIRKVDYWFVTHPDTDHISGVLEILSSGYEVGCLVVTQGASKDENFQKLIELAHQAGTKVEFMKAGDQLVTTHTTLRCLYPSTDTNATGNEASLVIELVYEEEETFRALFTGDISSQVEKELIQQGLLSDVDLYKAAHHGSRYSNSEGFLKVILPDIAVVSCAKNNVYGHPSPEAVNRMESHGAELFYTMENGQITIRYENGKIKLEKFCKF